MLNYRAILVIGSVVLALFFGLAAGSVAYLQTWKATVFLLVFLPISIAGTLILEWISKTARRRDAEGKQLPYKEDEPHS